MKQVYRVVLACLALLPMAAVAGSVPVVTVPTLSEVALIALGGGLGVAGLLVLWRRRK